nr:hypothetical protein [Endozoicomonas sp.]
MGYGGNLPMFFLMALAVTCGAVGYFVTRFQWAAWLLPVTLIALFFFNVIFVNIEIRLFSWVKVLTLAFS